jgi:hypothetical protein
MLDFIYMTYEIKMLLDLPHWSICARTPSRRVGRSRPVCLVCHELEIRVSQAYAEGWYLTFRGIIWRGRELMQ